MLGTQTSGTDVDPLFLTIYNDGSPGDIGHPAPCGMALGVGNIIPDHRFFATQLTLQRLLLLTRTSFSCRIQLKNITQAGQSGKQIADWGCFATGVSR
jgi:hypothetical protein